MALEKGYCIYCKKIDDEKRIFEVNPSAKTCFCPHCMKEMTPDKAMGEYKYFIFSLTYKGQKQLFQNTDFVSAYQTFAHILDIDPNHDLAHYGRILALIYMSTLRKSKILDAYALFETEYKLFRKYSLFGYRKFIDQIIRALDEYLALLSKKVTSHKYFYNSSCIKLYVERVYEVHLFKIMLLKEVEFINKEAPDNHVNATLQCLNIAIKEYEKLLKSNLLCADGYKYKVVSFNHKKEAVLSKSLEQIKVLVNIKPYVLDEKDGKGKLLKEQIYPDNIHISKMIKGAIPMAVIFLVIFLMSLSVGLSCMQNKTTFSIAISVAAFGFIGLIISLVFFFVWRRKLRKR